MVCRCSGPPTSSLAVVGGEDGGVDLKVVAVLGWSCMVVGMDEVMYGGIQEVEV